MRLIDADLLRQSIVDKRNRTVAPVVTIETLNWVIRQIRRQPTVNCTPTVDREKTVAEDQVE